MSPRGYLAQVRSALDESEKQTLIIAISKFYLESQPRLNL